MIRRFDTSVPEERTRGLDLATGAVRRGELVVLPTDTVYGIGADAFRPEAISALLAAKGRGRDMPVPVLVGSPRTVDGIARNLTQDAHDLMDAFWPGALTLVCDAQPSLSWDLGDTRGTVAVRMPLHPVAIELLVGVGPMGVSSANRSGMPAATNVDDAVRQLGDSVAVYLDAGPTQDAVPSTILDLTGDVPRVLRAGAVSLTVLREVVPTVEAGD